MKRLLKKWFCLHNWKSHAIEKHKWTEREMVDGTEGWMCPEWQDMEYSKVKEVLICEHCGNIKMIEY